MLIFPPCCQDMAALLESGTAADMTFKVEDEEMKVHRIILQVWRVAAMMKPAV